MLDRLRRLIERPAFRARPLRVSLRALAWAFVVAAGARPAFRLSRGPERLRVPPDMRYTSLTVFLLRDALEPELEILDRFVRPGDVVVDVGANIGIYSLKAAGLIGPQGRVLSLEPGAAAFAQLEDNIALNDFPWVRPLRCAAADRCGEVQLQHVELGDDPQAYSLVGAASEAETVEAVTLDALAAREGLSRIDFLKIDVEGGEALVLAGARDVLARHRPLLLCEMNAHLAVDGDPANSAQAWARLVEADYRGLRWTNGRFVALDAMPTDFCNIVAVPSESADAFLAAQRRP